MLFSEALISLAIKQKELYQYLLHKNNYDNEYAEPESIQWVKEQVVKYFEIAGNNGKVVDWMLAMEKQGLELEQLEQFMKWFRMKQQSLPVQERDIFKWDATAVSSILENQNMDEKAQQAVSEIYNQGGYSIIKADTPEAIVSVANCDGRNANSWCIKGFEHAKSYGPPAYFIKKNGQNYIAVLPNSEEIRNLKDEAVSDTATLNEIYPMVSFIIEKEYAGRWPQGGAFVYISRHMDKNLIPTLLDAANSDYNMDNVNMGNGPSAKILRYLEELLLTNLSKTGKANLPEVKSVLDQILQKNINNQPFLDRIGGYLNYLVGGKNQIESYYGGYLNTEMEDLRILYNLDQIDQKEYSRRIQVAMDNMKPIIKEIMSFVGYYAQLFYDASEKLGQPNAS